MPILICGALAYDTVLETTASFTGLMQRHPLAFQAHAMRREWGGCAGNIAYALCQLGGEPLPLAAVGSDGARYLARLRRLGISTDCVQRVPHVRCAHATIISGEGGRQITVFHAGAAAAEPFPAVPQRTDIALAILAPEVRAATLAHAAQLVVARIPFVFDPGQSLGEFNREELACLTAQACCTAVNENEARLLAARLALDVRRLAAHCGTLFVTLGARGCDVWERQGQGAGCTHVPGVPAHVVDPTGCGDAWRGALLYGLARGDSPVRCAQLGSRLGALAAASLGAQGWCMTDARQCCCTP